MHDSSQVIWFIPGFIWFGTHVGSPSKQRHKNGKRKREEKRKSKKFRRRLVWRSTERSIKYRKQKGGMRSREYSEDKENQEIACGLFIRKTLHILALKKQTSPMPVT